MNYVFVSLFLCLHMNVFICMQWYIDASVWNIECWPLIMNSNSGVVEIVQSANRCLHTGAWGMGTGQILNADLVALFQLDLVNVQWLSFGFPFNELSWLNYKN